MKNKICVEVINHTFEVPANGYCHCVIHILPQNEEVEIFIKNTECFVDEIEQFQKLETCKYYEADTEEYDFLIEMIKKHQYKKVK